MKKKIVAVLLAGAVISSLAACGSADGGKNSAPEKNKTETSAGSVQKDASSSEADTKETSEQTGARQNSQDTGSSQDAVTGNSSEESISGSQEETQNETDPTAKDDAPVADADHSDPDETVADPADITVNSPETAEELLRAVYGTEDAESGNSYSFQYLDQFSLNGNEYYGFQWSWLVDGDHMSKISDVLVQTDGKAVYQGIYNGTEWEEVYFDDNQLP